MQEVDFMRLWTSLDERLAETVRLNKRQAEEITQLKINSLLGSMRPVKWFALAVGFLWIMLIDSLLVATYHGAGPFFWWSALAQVAVCKVAVGMYLYQLILLSGTDSSEPVLGTQARIARLQSSTLWVTRILFLQLPVWTTFYLSFSMLEQASIPALVLQAVATGGAVFAAIWLFVHIRESNKNARWFRLLFRGREWEPLLKSLELLDQTREYQGVRTS